ncbi:MAG: hypothetical protein M0R51_14610 [Clostridia bacterium]|jgi:hypothetical protein|nr:hypothetical protein [Clostridia bacterium]
MSNTGYLSPLLMTLFWCVLGYFVYDGINGAIAIFALSFLYSAAALISIIPGIGIIIQYYVSIYLILPFIIELTGITVSWLTTAMLVVSMIYGVIITIIMVYAVMGAISR